MAKTLKSVTIYLVAYDKAAFVCSKCEFSNYHDCVEIRKIIPCTGGYLTTKKPEGG
jgi:hypothetical protein